MFRNKAKKKETDYSNTVSVLYSAFEPAMKAASRIPSDQILPIIQQRLNTVLNDYSSDRFEIDKQYTDFFHAGFSLKQKQRAIDRFRQLLNGSENTITDADVNALRNGDLGKALRAETQKLAQEAGAKDISSIHGTVEYLQYRHFNQGPLADKVAREAVKGALSLVKNLL